MEAFTAAAGTAGASSLASATETEALLVTSFSVAPGERSMAPERSIVLLLVWALRAVDMDHVEEGEEEVTEPLVV